MYVIIRMIDGYKCTWVYISWHSQTWCCEDTSLYFLRGTIAEAAPTTSHASFHPPVLLVFVMPSCFIFLIALCSIWNYPVYLFVTEVVCTIYPESSMFVGVFWIKSQMNSHRCAYISLENLEVFLKVEMLSYTFNTITGKEGSGKASG